jgi:hypothetical protein
MLEAIRSSETSVLARATGVTSEKTAFCEYDVCSGMCAVQVKVAREQLVDSAYLKAQNFEDDGDRLLCLVE